MVGKRPPQAHGRRRWPAIGALAAAATGAALLTSSPWSTDEERQSAPARAGWWRPYSVASPFNVRVSVDSRVAPSSRSVVRRLVRGGAVAPFVFGDPDRDGGVPVYVSRPRDPLYRLRCGYRRWGTCELEGVTVRIPGPASPAGRYPDRAGAHDGHMAILDPATGWEYDLWNVTSKPISGGVLRFAWGGRTRLDGRGLGSAANAAGYGLLAGLIRVGELRHERIPHALAMVVPCTAGSVHPAAGTGLRCASIGLPEAGAPRMGARFRLDMSRREIATLRVAGWKRAILQALSRYGAIVSDTTGRADQWGFEVESANGFTSLGRANPYVGLAKRYGIAPANWDGDGQAEYVFDLASGVDWSRLQLLEPCVGYGRC